MKGKSGKKYKNFKLFFLKVSGKGQKGKLKRK